MKKLISISILAMITMILIISGCTDPYNPPDPHPENISIEISTQVITPIEEPSGYYGNHMIVGSSIEDYNGKAYIGFVPTSSVHKEGIPGINPSIDDLVILKEVSFVNGLANVTLDGKSPVEGFYVVVYNNSGQSNRIQAFSGLENQEYFLPLLKQTEGGQGSIVGHWIFGDLGQEDTREHQVIPHGYNMTPDNMGNYSGLKEIIIAENGFNISEEFPEFIEAYTEQLRNFFGNNVEISVISGNKDTEEGELVVTFKDIPTAIYGTYISSPYKKYADGKLYISPFIEKGDVSLNINVYNKSCPISLEGLLKPAFTEALNAMFRPTSEVPDGEIIMPFSFFGYPDNDGNLLNLQASDIIFTEKLNLLAGNIMSCPAMEDPDKYNPTPESDWTQKGFQLNIAGPILYIKNENLPNWIGSDQMFDNAPNGIYLLNSERLVEEEFWNEVDQKIEQYRDNQNSKLSPKGE